MAISLTSILSNDGPAMGPYGSGNSATINIQKAQNGVILFISCAGQPQEATVFEGDAAEVEPKIKAKINDSITI